MIVFLQIFLVIFLILLNGFFVASEIALVSLRKTRIDELVAKNKPAAHLVQHALSDLERYISATQLGITIVSIGIGWFGEPTVATIFEPLLSFLPHNVAFISAHIIAIVIAFVVITYFEVVLGEVVPKTITLHHAESIALWTIRPLMIFSNIFNPFIWLLHVSGRKILTLLGQSKKITAFPVTEEELTLMLAQSAGTGSIEKEEASMVQKLFRMDDLPIKNLMIPRNKIIAFPLTATVQEASASLTKHTYSRLPIYNRSLDTVVGFLHIRDIYSLENQGKDHAHFSEIRLRKIIQVKDTTKIDDVLEEMKKRRTHLAVVIKNNKTVGIVTLEDIVESVMGDIEDEFEIVK